MLDLLACHHLGYINDLCLCLYYLDGVWRSPTILPRLTLKTWPNPPPPIHLRIWYEGGRTWTRLLLRAYWWSDRWLLWWHIRKYWASESVRAQQRLKGGGSARAVSPARLRYSATSTLNIWNPEYASGMLGFELAMEALRLVILLCWPGARRFRANQREAKPFQTRQTVLYPIK
jgi:hypothetical protein